MAAMFSAGSDSVICPARLRALCLLSRLRALLGAVFPPRSSLRSSLVSPDGTAPFGSRGCVIPARLRALLGAAFPRRSSLALLAPQSRRRRALRLAGTQGVG